MKAITYSLWGSDQRYTIGALKNADLAKTHYPDWNCIFYCSTSVPAHIVNELSSRENVVVRIVEENRNKKNATWRFFPAEEEGIEYLISRDCDSRLSRREAIAVNEWIVSEKDFHIMRDHPYHGGHPILAGMFGVRGGKLNGIKKAVENYVMNVDENYKSVDQDFLASWVWPKLEKCEMTVIIHDPIFLKLPFPKEAKRGNENGGVFFVGQVFDEHDTLLIENDIHLLNDLSES